MVIKNETQNNIWVEIWNETQNNIKNEDEDSHDKVGDSESIAKYEKKQSETKQYYNIHNKRAPNYSCMKTAKYLNAHVKTIYHLNVLSAIAEFHKPDI